MENFENKQINNNDNEISLIDLFSVLIRYRKLIIFGTLLLSILAILGFSVLKGNNENQKELYRVEFTIPFLINKNDVNTLIGFDFVNDTVLKFKDINTVATINKNFNMLDYDFSRQPFNQLSYNKFIYDVLQKKVYDTKLNSTMSEIILTVKTHSVEESEKFVKNIVNEINEEYYNFLLPLVSNKLDLLNEILDNNKNKVSLNAVINENDLLKEQLGLQTILKNDITIFDTVKSPLVFKHDAKSIYPIYILIIGGIFCLFVFIAFILNAIKNVKSDKKSVEKIKSAWTAGKKLFP